MTSGGIGKKEDSEKLNANKYLSAFGILDQLIIFLYKKFKGLPTLFMVDKNGIVINKTAGFVDGDESKYLEMVTQYLDSENIKYEEFNFEKESKVKKDAILQIDF